MPSFSRKSLSKLNTCDERLQRIFMEVIKKEDCTILCGTRSKEDQNMMYKTHRSKLKYPQSKHNRLPSKAVDVAPYPID